MPSKPRHILTKIVVFVLFGLLIISFVTWGVGDIIRQPSGVVAVATVGDERIDERDFRRALTREMNRLSARFGGRLDIEQARAIGVVDQVLAQLIGRALFDRKADDLGLVVTKTQIGRYVSEEPAFQDNTGAFSRARFVQALQISNLGEKEYVDSLTRDIIRQQIAGAVTGAVSVPRQLAEEIFKYRHERRVAQILTVPLGDVGDLPPPEEAALEKIHAAESASFMAPEYRALTYILLRAEDFADEAAVSESELRNEYEVRREDFAMPERRAIEQIILPDETTARAAESKLQEGGDFAAVAEEITGAPPIALDEVMADELPVALADATFAAAPGSATAPIQSALGWHIVRVLSVTPGHEPAFDEIRKELAQDMAMRLAVDSMVSIANELDDTLGAGASLADAANSLNLKIRHVEAVDRDGSGPDGAPVADLPGEPFLELAFSTPAGSDSLLSEASDGGYFVLHTDSVREARLRPLSEVREQVVALWRQRELAVRAEAQAQALVERLKAGQDMAALAAEAGLEVRTLEPLSRFDSRAPGNPAPTLPSKLFQLHPNEVTSAQAPNGYIVAQLDKVIPADPSASADDLADVQDGLTTALRGDLLEQFAAALRARYGVSVDQRLLENTLAAY